MGRVIYALGGSVIYQRRRILRCKIYTPPESLLNRVSKKNDASITFLRVIYRQPFTKMRGGRRRQRTLEVDGDVPPMRQRRPVCLRRGFSGHHSGNGYSGSLANHSPASRAHVRPLLRPARKKVARRYSRLFRASVFKWTPEKSPLAATNSRPSRIAHAGRLPRRRGPNTRD